MAVGVAARQGDGPRSVWSRAAPKFSPILHFQLAVEPLEFPQPGPLRYLQRRLMFCMLFPLGPDPVAERRLVDTQLPRYIRYSTRGFHALDRERLLEPRIAELERRLGMDSSNSGTPGSKEPIGAKERRKAERRDRDTSERERRKDRKRGGQPGHPGAGLSRDRDPDERKTADPPAQCSGCGRAWPG